MANFLQESSDKFCYVYSCELDNPIRIKIGTLEGQIKKKDANAVISDPLLQFSGQYVSEYSDFYVQAIVYANGKPLCLPVRTSYKPFTKRWNWNEWLQIPLRYKDLPRNAILGLTVYDIQGPREVTPVGGTTVSLFNRHSCLRRGFRDLRLWPETEADCSLQDSTPGLPVGQEGSEMDRLAKLVQQHRKGRMMPVDWLDRLTFREIEQVNEREKRESNYIFLTIEFPKFHVDTIEYNVIFFEPDGDLLDESLVASDYSVVQEPDKNLENLVESKHHKLSHSLRIGSGALELKPNPETKTRLQAIIQQPPTQSLNTDDKSLIWQFRYYLSLDKGALTKFLQCVDWGSNQESEEALDLLAKWQPLEPAAALELLTPKFQSPVHPRVRKYAMSRLQCADNEELLLYLLQLVQALRYETPSFSERATSAFVPTLVADQVYSEATHTQLEAQLSDAFKEDDEEEKGFVSLSVRETNSDSDSDDGDESRRIGGLMSPDTPPVLGRDYINPLASFESSIISVDLSSSTLMSASVVEVEFPDLASFLIARACRSTRLANYFHWYVYVECQEDKDPASKEKYESIRSKFLDDLRNSPRPKWRKRYAMLIQQVELVDQLSGLMKTLLASKDDRIKKMEKLQSIIKGDVGLVRFKQLIRLPVDPHIQATGIIPSEATLFKSALMPARFNFKVKSGEKYSVMFKVGDDLRQDQLILQMIMLIDRLLRRENLDLKLTPYKVLACSGTLGFVQLIQRSDTVAHILATHKSIQAYFRAHGSSDKGAYGISPEIMDTYIKSCAGYSVITYLLSVGDRHLDNLLLMETGNLIHIDFGYILGRDPKIFPPPMRLSKEMVDAMGGTSSKEFSQFREHCYNAFLTLRRSANLFLNLFSLMLDSGVPDIALEPDKTVQKVEDKFRLDLSDEEAVKYLQGLIDLSIRAIFPELFEKIHKIAQDFRK
ncbi:PREDICTED: phosphatidylinositol 3-kinase catalytic subunit type 3-like [Amphimedon queenslandica]|uniref:Phosphatidylinositol 3-kinase catalytic subunit type 3 n=1 Tax=Amphimedon queenslandica TaxID=400682 RepID=A0A1X7VLA5_AMPQE|nr:PREDICTED: phosphatidylinositol 3-kinase catalytic subunit type 3-like [Amphimedon queenslandica]|eukprot:XP_019862704.1 PREDICTED: phosphatidylinositol 3-kinase catalytic subunit type 3-like [Amphimedon queenslandica]